MTNYQSDFLRISKERGFIHQGTDLNALDELMQKGPISAYLGFDATAASLHVGSLVGIMWLRLLQKTGNRPIILMGGGTTKIGDPTGKDEARKTLNDADIQTNIDGIKGVFSRYLKVNSEKDALFVNNNDWLCNINYLDFLGNYGRHFTINRMLTMDSVKLRLERQSPLSFLEFNYMILQAYDFLHLNRHYDCHLQLGGSDQWGNIIGGVELVRRLEGKNAYGITTPLITTPSGLKMGKTAKGAVWLNGDALSAFDYWQFWRNTHDQDVGRYLRLFTELPLGEIQRLEILPGAELNEAKKILANEATTLAHGAESLALIHNTVSQTFAGQTFEGQNRGGEIINNNIITLCLTPNQLAMGIDDLLLSLKLVTSKSEAKRLIQGGGVKINDRPVENSKLALSDGDFKTNDYNKVLDAKISYVKVSLGKKKHYWLELAKQ